MKLQQLVAILHQAGLKPHVLTTLTGGAIVVLPHGARVIGLFTSPEGDNVFYTNPEFASPEALQALVAKPGHVLGGDRLWLAPERGLFFVTSQEADGTVVAPSIDPGNFVITGATDRSIRFLNQIDAPYHLIKGSSVRALVERSIRRIPSPFFHAPDALPCLKNVAFAGYEIASRCELQSAPSDTLYFGLWFLIQLVCPHGGYAYIPTHGRSPITDYYEPTGPDYLRVDDTHVRFKIDSIDRHKIGVRKIEAAGKVAFLSHEQESQKGGQSTLVIRNFLNNPSAHYADVPLDNPSGNTQDSIQCYNHNTGSSGFGEIEFHTPGINRAMPEPVVYDTNQVWVFTGARSDLVAIAARLLGLAASTFQV